MNLIDLLKIWDTHLFLLINGIHATFFDSFMYAVSEKLTWVPLYISVLYLVIKHWKREAIWIVLALILCIVISDQIASGLLKDLVKRLRPSHAADLKGVVHLVKGYAGGKYGFASSHAANAFGFAMLSSLLIKRKLYTYAIFLWAVITAYSRIYLGVHYPLDILGGAAVGVLAAFGCYWLIRKYRPSLIQQDANDVSEMTIIVPVSVLSLSFIGIIVYSLIC
ncbi:MAG: phosphatase PAP2 family protein [Bacteroidota bacterium]|nr:phosphatase PAP2 family protein [Bacteroidota bacterium]